MPNVDKIQHVVWIVDMSSIFVILAVAALLTSVVSAMIGMAGGIALLGVMTALLPAKQVVPLHGVVQLSSNFTRTVAFLRFVHWKIWSLFAGPAVFGIWIGSQLWAGTKLDWFKPVIGCFILLFVLWRHFKRQLRNPPAFIYPILGLMTGILSIFVGATGPFLAPFFLRDDFDNEQVIATKAACQFWLHLFKIPAFLALGFDYLAHTDILAMLVLCVIIGTLIGKRLLRGVSKKAFTWTFETVLSAVALYLIVGWIL